MPISSTKRAWIVVAVAGCRGCSRRRRSISTLLRPLPLRLRAPGPAGPHEPAVSSGAPVVAYIDVAALRKLQDSPLAAMLGLAGAQPEQDREYQAFVRDTGFDYTRDLDEAAIAMWPTSVMAPKGRLGDNLVLAIADGRFDQEKIKA